jgi:cytochrome c biogenesis protein CcmG/thiol:disulfide interchange protein DsbE
MFGRRPSRSRRGFAAPTDDSDGERLSSEATNGHARAARLPGLLGQSAKHFARFVAQALSVALVVGLLALLVWKVSHQTGSHNVAAQVRKGETPAAPDFTLPRLDGGGKLSLAELGGKPLVINFWASWCGPCRDEAPLLQAAAREYHGQLVVLGVDYQDFTGDARKFVRKFDLTYPIVRDGDGSLLARWGVTGAPESFFVDRAGKVVAHVAGAVDKETLPAGIRKALIG